MMTDRSSTTGTASAGREQEPCILVLPLAAAGNIELRPDRLQFVRARASVPVLDPWEAVEALEEALHGGVGVTFVEVAGPGEPLVCESVFAALHLLKARRPRLQLRVVTNGLALSDRLADLVAGGVRHVAVEIHAVSPRTAERIYASATMRGRRLKGMEAAEAIVRTQWQAVMNAIECGMDVEVRTLRCAGVNDDEIGRIVQWTAMLGAASAVTEA